MKLGYRKLVNEYYKNLKVTERHIEASSKSNFKISFKKHHYQDRRKKLKVMRNKSVKSKLNLTIKRSMTPKTEEFRLMTSEASILSGSRSTKNKFRNKFSILEYIKKNQIKRRKEKRSKGTTLYSTNARPDFNCFSKSFAKNSYRGQLESKVDPLHTYKLRQKIKSDLEARRDITDNRLNIDPIIKLKDFLF